MVSFIAMGRDDAHAPNAKAQRRASPTELTACGVLMRFAIGSNENKMSDGGRERASVGVEVWKSSQKWRVQRSVVRSIAWLDFWSEYLAASSGKEQKKYSGDSNTERDPGISLCT